MDLWHLSVSAAESRTQNGLWTGQRNIGIAGKLSSIVPVSPLVPRPLTKRKAAAGVLVGLPRMLNTRGVSSFND